MCVLDGVLKRCVMRVYRGRNVPSDHHLTEQHKVLSIPRGNYPLDTIDLIPYHFSMHRYLYIERVC